MKRGQRGFTLIELMVALVVSSLLVGMILAIFSRMSIAYRGQQQIAGVQQVLAAARATIEFDAKQAGLAMPQGFVFAGDGKLHPAVSITNSSTGPDQLAFFYADSSTQALVVPAVWGSTLTVDDTSGFAVNDLVVVSTADLTTGGLGSNDGNIAKYAACTLKVQGKTSTTLQFFTTPPWGSANEGHCGAAGLANPSATTLIYKFVAHGYRIDTTTAVNAAIGALQLSANGGLLGAADIWNPLAFGFTDLQTSLQIFHQFSPAPWPPVGDTLDPDADGVRDWYSGALQDTLTQPTTLVGNPVDPRDGLLQISISLVARTDRDVEGIATAVTPTLTDPVNPNNNMLGDHAQVTLPSATDPALQGSRIYRYTTFQVDFRNLGVGR
jgi:prepilin-type N-terminal cleavage/methylation domain-containing protein